MDSPTNTLRNIGPYLVYEELGRGAGGVVYRALDPRIGRDIAIKELTISRLGPDEVEEARQRFVREARAVGNLRHDNVVMLYQFLEEKDSLYLVMEYVAGGSLHALIKRGGPLSVEAALGIIRQVAAALDHAHALGIVHRDIKPGNILISSAPGAVVPSVKVADFGIARISSEQMTMPGVSFGTPAYMAPEQINGSVVDAKADQFALGVVAYELLARRRPFLGANDQGLVYQILNAEPAPVTEGNPELPTGVDRVLRRALSKNPAQRFESCGAFAAALEDVLLGSPEVTRKSVAPLQTQRTAVPEKRSGRGALVGGLIAALLVAGGLGLYFNSQGDHRTPVTPRKTGSGLPTPGAGAPTAPPPVADVVIPARLLRRVPPQYPAAARSLRIQGVVKLEATIGPDGSVRNLRVVSGNPYLVDAAKRAVEDWKYQPARLHGEPVEAKTTVDVNFKLGDQAR